MPKLQKVIDLGKGSRGITLDAKWLKFYEQRHDVKIDSVEVEVNGEIKVKPHIPR